MESKPIKTAWSKDDRNGKSKKDAIFFWLLPISIIIGAGLSIGLTYATCYAQICTQDYFPFETRLHVGVFYLWLFLIGLFLFSVRPRSSWSRFWERTHRISFGRLGLWHPNNAEFLFYFWLLGMLGFASGIFWNPMFKFFFAIMYRTQPTWTYLITFVGITGHWTDVLLGLVFISIGRNSTLAWFFKIPVEHSIYYHKVTSYLLMFAVIIHMVPVYAAIGIRVATIPDSLSDLASAVNPYVSYAAITYWQWGVLASGILALIFIIVITITSLQRVRTNNFNVFYFTHFLWVGVLFLACVHAATDFYLVLPGLITYSVDGLFRLFEVKKTYRALLVKEMGDDNLYRIQMIDQPKRCAINAPFTYYINVPTCSKRELHPFTSPSSPQAASDGTELSFLFRPVTQTDGTKKRKLEWTQKLAQLHAVNGGKDVEIKVHMEGPYVTPIPRVTRFDLVLCIVGGTGITGALSFGHTVIESLQDRLHGENATRCVILWSVREDESAIVQLKNVRDLMDRPQASAIISLVVHNTRSKGRLNVDEQFRKYMSEAQLPFVYTSGPAGLMEQVASLCRAESRHRKMFWHEAQWDS